MVPRTSTSTDAQPSGEVPATDPPKAKPVGTRAARAARTRQQLVLAAIELFSVNAYEDVAVADIARSAGVAHGLLFHYFGTKRGVYLAALEETVARMNDSFAVPDSAPREQIRAALVHRLRYLAEHRGLALRAVQAGRGEDPQAWDVFEAARWNELSMAAALLGLDSSNRTLRMVGRTIVAIFDEMTVQWLGNEERPHVDSVVDWILASAVSCLRSATLLDPDLDLDHALAALDEPAHP